MYRRVQPGVQECEKAICRLAATERDISSKREIVARTLTQVRFSPFFPNSMCEKKKFFDCFLVAAFCRFCDRLEISSKNEKPVMIQSSVIKESCNKITKKLKNHFLTLDLIAGKIFLKGFYMPRTGSVPCCCVTLGRYRDSVTRFFASDFFYESVTPQPQSIPLGPFRIFSKISGDIRSSRLTVSLTPVANEKNL